MAFSGKVVVVTGAASGIGAATALEFIKAGGEVAIVDKNGPKLEEVAAECAALGKKPLIIKADLSNQDEVSTIVTKTIDTFRRLDVLVNSAGTMKTASLLQENLLDSYDTVMATNLRAAVQLTSLAAPYIIKVKGNIINIASVLATVPDADHVTYCISKAALNHFTRCAAVELAPFDVRVNAICPGPVKTNILDNANSNTTFEDLKKMTALDKVAEVTEIADLILFLASDKGRSITGSSYVSDNGFLLKS